MVKEFEKAGLPIVHLTTLTGLAQGVGANRIVAGHAITNPVGDYELSGKMEYESVRVPIMVKCLIALQTDVAEPTIFS